MHETRHAPPEHGEEEMQRITASGTQVYIERETYEEQCQETKHAMKKNRDMNIDRQKERERERDRETTRQKDTKQT